MKFQALGRLEVTGSDGAARQLRGARQRILLAALLLNAPEPLSRDRMIDVLWPDDLPQDPVNALHLQLAKIRRLFGDDRERIERRDGSGYQLRLFPGEFDVHTFSQLSIRTALFVTRQSWPEAVTSAEEALSLWRGPALADVGSHPALDSRRASLEEARVTTCEQLAEARIAQRQYSLVIPELTTLIADFPLRENLCGLLMRALYGAGRQAESIDVFHRAAARLREGLGLDPSPALQALYRAVLDHDATALGISLWPYPGPAPGVENTDTTPDAVPADTARPPATGNLRAALTPLTGRAEELAALRELLCEQRLVTVVGPVGVGKSRLAAEAASGLEGRFSGGSWLVQLSALPVDARQGQVLDALADTFGLPDGGPGGTRVEDLAGFVAERRMLLILDSCEHVREAVATTVDVLARSCPALTVLATGLEPLAVAHEAVLRLGPLTQDAALELLLRHTARDLPGPEWDAASRDTALRICRQLDCLPLAIELAGAATRVLTVAEIEAHIGAGDFQLLAQPLGPAPARHATLQAALDWGYGLLTPQERQCLRALTCFLATWDLESAEHICASEFVPRRKVAYLLGQLVTKSLIQIIRTEAGTRFRMLSTVRNHVLGQMAAADAPHRRALRPAHKTPVPSSLP